MPIPDLYATDGTSVTNVHEANGHHVHAGTVPSVLGSNYGMCGGKSGTSRALLTIEPLKMDI